MVQWSGRDWSFKKTGTVWTYFCIFPFCTGHYTLGIAGSVSWPYYIGPKRGRGQVCLTKQCLHPFPRRWRGLESPLLFSYWFFCFFIGSQILLLRERPHKLNMDMSKKPNSPTQSTSASCDEGATSSTMFDTEFTSQVCCLICRTLD